MEYDYEDDSTGLLPPPSLLQVFVGLWGILLIVLSCIYTYKLY